MERSYILHARSYLDDSLLLHCLTEQHDRILLVAKRARLAKSPWRGLLQPFQELCLAWRGRGSVMTLTQAEGQGLAYFFKGKCLLAALYVNELTDRLIQKSEPEPRLFQQYAQVLRDLKENDSLEVILRRFELALLSSLGYALPLTYQVATGEEVSPQHYYRFHWQQGATYMPARPNPHPEWISGQSLLAMAADDWTLSETRMEAKKLMRLIFKDILETRGLQSADVFAMI